MKILAINTGSSSCKGALFDFEKSTPQKALWEGLLDWGKADTLLRTETSHGKREVTKNEHAFENLLPLLLQTLWEGPDAVISSFRDISAIVHRVVHGGKDFIQPTLINKEVKQKIDNLSELAPLHNPINLKGMNVIEALVPNKPQWAVFDTAFHHTIPPAIYTYPIPLEWEKKGVRRYGFHGISHQYCSREAAKLLNKSIDDLKMISCHLGNGSSLCAISQGKSLNTTMGFTPLDGLMMGTRSGTFDTSAVLYLGQKEKNIEDLLFKQAGIKGIFASSGDMRDVLESAEKGDFRAQLALEMYIQILKENIGRMLMTIGGLDLLIFTGGIGENVSIIRQNVVESFKFLGAEIDSEKNKLNRLNDTITTPESSLLAMTIHTEENWEMAQQIYSHVHKRSN